jgi:hypothetical protein
MMVACRLLLTLFLLTLLAFTISLLAISARIGHFQNCPFSYRCSFFHHISLFLSNFFVQKNAFLSKTDRKSANSLRMKMIVRTGWRTDKGIALRIEKGLLFPQVWKKWTEQMNDTTQPVFRQGEWGQREMSHRNLRKIFANLALSRNNRDKFAIFAVNLVGHNLKMKFRMCACRRLI